MALGKLALVAAACVLVTTLGNGALAATPAGAVTVSYQHESAGTCMPPWCM